MGSREEPAFVTPRRGRLPGKVSDRKFIASRDDGPAAELAQADVELQKDVRKSSEGGPALQLEQPEAGEPVSPFLARRPQVLHQGAGGGVGAG